MFLRITPQSCCTIRHAKLRITKCCITVIFCTQCRIGAGDVAAAFPSEIFWTKLIRFGQI